jgi:hypothetical protein
MSIYSDHAAPIIIDVAAAHRTGAVRYQADGVVLFRHSRLGELGLPEILSLPPRRQYPAVRATFDDLNKALSRLANSPTIDARTLREL